MPALKLPNSNTEREPGHLVDHVLVLAERIDLTIDSHARKVDLTKRFAVCPEDRIAANGPGKWAVYKTTRRALNTIELRREQVELYASQASDEIRSIHAVLTVVDK